MSYGGVYLRSRAELIMRGSPRDEPLTLWGWEGCPRAAPPAPPAVPPAASPVCNSAFEPDVHLLVANLVWIPKRAGVILILEPARAAF